MVQGAYEAFGRGDVAAVIDLMEDDVDWSSPATLPHGGQFHGKAGVGEFFQGLGGAWESLSLEVESVSEAGTDLVIGIVRADGQRRGGGADGYGAAHVFSIHDGKVARFREYVDLDKPLG